MNRKKNLIFFLLLILLVNCSFDDKSGIWKESIEENKRVVELEKKQQTEINRIKIYSSENSYSKEVILNKEISLSPAKKNSSWEMSGLNYQNFIGNIYLPGINNIFLKEKVGKNKFSLSKVTASPLIYKNYILLLDDRGTIFNISRNGEKIWKKNIYKKIYKKIYKNLSFAIYKNIIYVSDNIGFIYAINLDNGKLLWIKNHGVPLKSKIKVQNDMIFLMNQDNRLLSFSIKDGSIIWDIRSISSFIKSQKFLSLAISKQDHLVAVNTAGELMNVNSKNGNIYWAQNTLGSLASDFFKSSDVVIDDGNIIFSTHSSFFSYNLNNGYVNWKKDVSSIGTPIIDGKNIFFVTENGYFVIINKDTGKIISSTNILKILKEKKRSTKITGFVMGSGKIYSVTLNGYLIVSSASSGKTEYSKKIGHRITSSPIINDGKLFIYTENSRIYGFN